MKSLVIANNSSRIGPMAKGCVSLLVMGALAVALLASFENSTDWLASALVLLWVAKIFVSHGSGPGLATSLAQPTSMRIDNRVHLWRTMGEKTYRLEDIRGVEYHRNHGRFVLRTADGKAWRMDTDEHDVATIRDFFAGLGLHCTLENSANLKMSRTPPRKSDA